MKTLSHLIIAVIFLTACNQKDNSVKTPVCENCNVSIDSGDLKLYIPLSLIDTSFSMVYDTKFDEVFLIDSFYNKERTLSITIKRDAGVRKGNIKDEDAIMRVAQGIDGIYKETNGGAEIFKADTGYINEYKKGALISYIYGDGWTGLALWVLHPDHGKWYRIDIRRKPVIERNDSVFTILGSINTRK